MIAGARLRCSNGSPSEMMLIVERPFGGADDAHRACLSRDDGRFVSLRRHGDVTFFHAQTERACSRRTAS